MEKQKDTFKQALLQFFKGDKYIAFSGITIVDVSQEKAVVQAEITEKHLNGNGCVQGGMLYTAADFAFAVLGNYLHPKTVTQGGQIQYLRAAYTRRITATATETERVGHNTVSQVIVRGDNDEILCVCHFNGFVKDVAKEEFIKNVYGKEEV